ncbi:MAG: heavy-metal-associated domain-containing protein [Rhodothermales bacterium]
MSVIIEKLTIEGMGCGHCVTAVQQALNGLEGVEAEKVEIGSAVVRYEEGRLPATAIDDAIRSAGYEPVTHERIRQ